MLEQFIQDWALILGVPTGVVRAMVAILPVSFWFIIAAKLFRIKSSHVDVEDDEAVDDTEQQKGFKKFKPRL